MWFNPSHTARICSDPMQELDNQHSEHILCRNNHEPKPRLEFNGRTFLHSVAEVHQGTSQCAQKSGPVELQIKARKQSSICMMF